MRVLHLAAECAPLVKVGGLGDVVGALPKFLASQGVEASVLLPHYGSRSPGEPGSLAPGALDDVHEGTIIYAGKRLLYAVRRVAGTSIPLLLLDEPEHFGGPGVYQDAATGHDFTNSADRWFVFTLAALDFLRSEAVAGRGFDLVHAHDHHAALVPALLREGDAYAALRDTPTVLTIHSAEHQGVYPWTAWAKLGVPVADPRPLFVGDELNAMAAGLHYADAVTTVSPGYADELTTDAAIAHGLIEQFRAARAKLTGILNGMDPGVWHPSHDPRLPANYDADDLAGKAESKHTLSRALGLDTEKPLLVYVGRLMKEKGVEVLLPGVEALVARGDVSLALLGSGYPEFDAQARQLAADAEAAGHGDRLHVRIGFDESLAHQLYAAADVFLMPSKVEPCGLGQLYAMTYGAVPVVHATGGLRDTVAPWDSATGTGTGFVFDRFAVDAFLASVDDALATFARPDEWARLQQNAMRADWSWSRSARDYASLYRALVRRP